MSDALEKIVTFINEHHVMSLATMDENELSVCSLFYAYDRETNSFVVASDDKTMHIQHIKENKNIAGNILLETKTVGKIQGLQFKGKFYPLENKLLKECYFKNFPYARALFPKLWEIRIESFKMSDNRLGFGKKIIWEM